jgi:hypothetical protein
VNKVNNNNNSSNSSSSSSNYSERTVFRCGIIAECNRLIQCPNCALNNVVPAIRQKASNLIASGSLSISALETLDVNLLLGLYWMCKIETRPDDKKERAPLMASASQPLMSIFDERNMRIARATAKHGQSKRRNRLRSNALGGARVVDANGCHLRSHAPRNFLAVILTIGFLLNSKNHPKCTICDIDERTLAGSNLLSCCLQLRQPTSICRGGRRAAEDI